MMTSNKKAILVVSFGTSYNDNRDKTIGAIERDISGSFPDREVRRAFTSKMIIGKLAERDNEHIDTVCEAMERLIDDGVDDLVVQPTHVMNGVEYDGVVADVSRYANSFENIAIGRPLLTTEDDYNRIVDVLERTLLPEAGSICKDPTVVLMGHGTSHFANATYSQLHLKLQLSGHENVFVTTVEGFPTFEDTCSMMEDKEIENVVLFPFMLVAGDHANNDMAGEEDSLRSLMESKGYSVYPVVKGLGEYPEFRKLFIGHIRDALGEM